jgi:hypothetical protein
MQHWMKRLAVAGAALFLSGCLWGPGKFASDLALKKDGSFTLDYRGEIVLQLPPDMDAKPEAWSPDRAHCQKDGTTTIVNPAISVLSEDEGKRSETRPCTAAETAKLKAEFEKQASEKAAEKRKSNEEMAKIFGLPGLDDASNRAFAAKLMKYEGWRSVTYRGNGVFDVDYHFAGRATQDFLFPALPDNDLIIPFIAIRRRADGSVMVTAPALTGGMGPLASRAGSAAATGKGGPVSRAEGRFTVMTDGEILTNNSEDGASPHPIGRQLVWNVGPASKKIPETLIRLR